MLPLVGIVAVGLLLVAGKLFFLSGFQPDRRDLPVIPGPPIPAGQEKSAQAETPPLPRKPERAVLPEKAAVSVDEIGKGRRSVGATLDVLAVPYDGKADSVPPSSDEKKSGNPAAGSKTKAPPAASRPSPQKAPVREQQTRAQAVRVVSPPSSGKKAAAVSSPAPAKPGWMVQVGAFSTQAAAEAVVQQLRKAGYTGTIISGKTLHRVLVQAGATREDALSMATRMSQSGFQGAFIVPPRS